MNKRQTTYWLPIFVFLNLSRLYLVCCCSKVCTAETISFRVLQVSWGSSMTKLEYSSCSGPSYTDLLPHASAGEDRQQDKRDNVKINPDKHGEYHAVTHMHAHKHSCQCLTLHLDQFGHVCAEQGINPLSLSVSIYVQLDVCWQAAENRCVQENERVDKTKETVPDARWILTALRTQCRAYTQGLRLLRACSRASGR